MRCDSTVIERKRAPQRALVHIISSIHLCIKHIAYTYTHFFSAIAEAVAAAVAAAAAVAVADEAAVAAEATVAAVRQIFSWHIYKHGSIVYFLITTITTTIAAAVRVDTTSQACRVADVAAANGRWRLLGIYSIIIGSPRDITENDRAARRGQGERSFKFASHPKHAPNDCD